MKKLAAYFIQPAILLLVLALPAAAQESCGEAQEAPAGACGGGAAITSPFLAASRAEAAPAPAVPPDARQRPVVKPAKLVSKDAADKQHFFCGPGIDQQAHKKNEHPHGAGIKAVEQAQHGAELQQRD